MIFYRQVRGFGAAKRVLGDSRLTFAVVNAGRCSTTRVPQQCGTANSNVFSKFLREEGAGQTEV